jgi:NDP-sugar pyrophosphorylase family protein
MKAMILAAGLGTRLKPWTLHHPKALVPVKNVPMLKRVICKLRDEGFDKIVVNVHHFADQIVDYLSENDFGVEISVSDEPEKLLNTGGGILHAENLLSVDNEPFLVHNVDILSNAELAKMLDLHKRSGSDATLIVSPRDSSRKLLFDENMSLVGWHNLNSDEYLPDGFECNPSMKQYAFSGIYILSPSVFPVMHKLIKTDSFSIIDFFLSALGSIHIKGVVAHNLKLIDIGKPDTLHRANDIDF